MSQLKQNIIANLFGRAWTNILGILFIPLYLKFLGIEAYGLVGFFQVLQSILGIMDLGIGATLNRELARLSVLDGKAQEQRDLLRTLEIIYWSIALFAGTLIVLGAPLIANHWLRTQNTSVETIITTVRLMGLSIVLQFPFAFYQGGLMGLQKQVLANGIQVIIGTLRSVGAVLVLWLLSPTIQAFMGWQLLSSATGVGMVIYYLWRSLPISDTISRFRKHLLQGIWKYSAAISGNAIIGVVLTQLDKVVLSKILTLEMLGYYTLAGSLAAVIWSIIIPLNSALFPKFVQLFETRNFQDLTRLFHRSSQFLSVLLLPLATVLMLFSKEVLLIWLRNPVTVENTYFIVSLLVLGATLNGLSSIPAYAVSAFGWPQLITYTNLIQAIIIVPAIVIMVTLYGVVGAALVWVAINGTFILIMVPIILNKYFRSEKWRWYIHDTGLPLIGSIITGSLAYLLMPQGVSRFNAFFWVFVTWSLTTFATIVLTPEVRSGIIGYLLKIKRVSY